MAQFAEHLPMLVMTQVVGMPEEYGPRLVEAARDLMKGTETAIASNDYVVATLRRMMERKRVAPGADLVSWLMQHDAGLTDDEVLEHLRVVLLAANETTVNLIADTLKLVLTDRRFRAHLSGGHMTLPDALDQVLWDTAPMSVVMRPLGHRRHRARRPARSRPATCSCSASPRATWTRWSAPTCRPRSTATAPTLPSAAGRTSARARTSAGPSPRPASTSC